MSLFSVSTEIQKLYQRIKTIKRWLSNEIDWCIISYVFLRFSISATWWSMHMTIWCKTWIHQNLFSSITIRSTIFLQMNYILLLYLYSHQMIMISFATFSCTTLLSDIFSENDFLSTETIKMTKDSVKKWETRLSRPPFVN